MAQEFRETAQKLHDHKHFLFLFLGPQAYEVWPKTMNQLAFSMERISEYSRVMRAIQLER